MDSFRGFVQKLGVGGAGGGGDGGHGRSRYVLLDDSCALSTFPPDN